MKRVSLDPLSRSARPGPCCAPPAEHRVASQTRRTRRSAAPGRASLFIPLGFYAAVTLLVPVLNGTAHGAAFAEHVFIVLLVSLLVGGAFTTVRLLLSRAPGR